MNLEQEIRCRFLDQLDQYWNDEEPRLDYGNAALPYFIVAFEQETNPERRERLIRIIWQFRDPAAFQILAVALSSQTSNIWKESLDGIVALGGNRAVESLKNARVTASVDREKLAWIDEALSQIAQEIGR